MTTKKLLVACLLAWACCVHASVSLRVAGSSDPLTMDPHIGDAMSLSFNANIYEPLVGRDKKMALTPVLAVAWSRPAPTVWRFALRKGVRFHDGTLLRAADVVFSLERAQHKNSDLRNSAIASVRALDEHAVEIVTKLPHPMLLDDIATTYIMSKAWAEARGAQVPGDRRTGEAGGAAFTANGTGPYRLMERQPAIRTVLARHPGYWGRIQGNLDEVVFRPMPVDAARVAALLSGAVDLIDPAPLRDVERIRTSGVFTVLQNPEVRTIFLGMDQKRDQLLHSNVKGRNPFKDKRVRQAFYQAIDIEAIRTKVLRDAARPTAQMVAPAVRGYQADLDRRLPYDPGASLRLLREAGFPDGFEVGMQCPNDRYVGDAAICEAIAAQLARVGITVRLQTESKVLYFPKMLRRELSFYLLGYAAITLDGSGTLEAVIATPDEAGRGRLNAGYYSNPRVDELTDAIQTELVEHKRDAMMREAFRLHQDDIGHIPLHDQMLCWAFRNELSVVQRPDNFMTFMWMSKRPR